MASSTATIRIVFNNFPGLLAAMQANGDAIIGQAAQAIASQAASSAPHLTGELAGSIQAHPVGPLHWEVTASSGHAAYVEYGTAKHGAAQPYLTPAAHNEEPAFQSAMRGIIPGA